jgi:hypothetical protein
MSRKENVSRPLLVARSIADRMMGSRGHSHSHRLRRHNRKILRRREMRQSESVPQHDVLVVKARVGVRGDPGGDALRGLAGGLGDVAAGGVELAVFVWRALC